MARITVEDCIDKFPSRFELVLVASNRARKLHSGENPTVEIDNDKNTVIALREIAEETLTSEQLKNDLIEEYQTNTFSEDEEINEIEDNSDENQSDLKDMQSVEASLEEASLYAFKEYEPSQQYEAGRDMKNIEDAIKKAGGRIKSKEKPTRREPNLSFEIETGNPTAVKAAIKKTDPEFNVESFDIEKLKEDVNTLWSTAGDSMEEMKKNAKYMKAQDVAPDNDSDAESEKEKSGKTLIGSKKTKIVTEPKVDYQK